MTLSELHESQPKPLPDHLRALANYCQWCARNVESLGDTSRWFLELETELRRIAALSTGWQPIETAPKDGQWVMLWWPHWEQFPAFGYFENCWHSQIAISSDNDPGPTHWQPLPAPPETKS